jgi:hypothetical protein
MKLAVKDMGRKTILLSLIVLLSASAACFCEEVTLTTILPASSGSSNVKVASGIFTSGGLGIPADTPSQPIDLSVAPYNFNPNKPWYVVLGNVSGETGSWYLGSISSYEKYPADPATEKKGFIITCYLEGYAGYHYPGIVGWLAIQA